MLTALVVYIVLHVGAIHARHIALLCCLLGLVTGKLCCSEAPLRILFVRLAAFAGSRMKLFCPDSLRALLRNLRLLDGQRPGRARRTVLVLGTQPEDLASSLAQLEPSLSPSLSVLKSWKNLTDFAGSEADAVIVSQVRQAMLTR